MANTKDATVQEKRYKMKPLEEVREKAKGLEAKAQWHCSLWLKAEGELRELKAEIRIRGFNAKR